MKIPLHHNRPLTQKLQSSRNRAQRKRDQERLELWQTMHDMNPKGFRPAPTSRKNPKTHARGPQTVLERLYAITA